MKHVAGLDGLRAVAVAVVLLFHAQVPGLSGGFLGVSLFFTLSGYLITSLLLIEHDASGTIALRQFYGRRIRRLLPAAYVCLLAVAACGALWSTAQLSRLQGDLIASVANVANWRFAFATTSYQELFTTAPSPVAHFWSLAIEEQIYLVAPVVVLVALRRGRRTLLMVTVALLLASVGASLMTADRDIVYNGTHTRAAEVIVGMLLAQLTARRSPAERPAGGRFGWMPGAAALAVFGALVVGASLDQEWIYRGGLPAVAVVSAVLIWAVVDGRFPNRVLATGPLVAIGAVSYGIYLFHWPIFLLLDADRTGLDGVALFTIRCLATAVVTVAVYELVEQPVRRRRVLPGRGMVPVLGVTAAIVVAAAIVVVPAPSLTEGEQLLALGERSVVDFGAVATETDAEAGLAEPMGAASAGVAVVEDGSTIESTPAATVPTPPLSVVVVGSDRASADAIGRLDGVVVTDATRPECPLSIAESDTCTSVESVVAPLVTASPDVVVFTTGMAESRNTLEQRLQATTDERIGELGQSDEAAIDATVAAIDVALASGATVIWYTAAHPISDYYRHFRRIAVTRSEMTVLHAPAWELVETVEGIAEQGAGPSVAEEPTRVLVIGDSTSLYLAQALNDGSDGRMSVLWAGSNGCPLGAVVETRGGSGNPWIPTDCEAYDTKLPPIVTDFDPDAVVVMTGPTELNDQRYADGNEGHAGDPTFAAARDAGFERLLATIGADLPVLVADVPALRPGRFTRGDMSSPERLAAVNAQVVEWAARHPQVDLLAYRDVLESAEAEQGSLRADGMHADPEPLEELARTVYVDRVLAQIGELQAILRP
ncbi:MAG: acyltransferase family protein [Ilumatobacteraceae bacterium]